LADLAGRQSEYGHNTKDGVAGWISYPTAEVTVFSDNVVLSFPVRTLYDEKQVMGVHLPFEPHKFAQHVFAQIVTASWKGLDLGVLFRGGVAVGNLFHKGNVVAGEALVRAASMEKETSVPRIEIAPELLELKDDHDQLVFPEDFQRFCITEREGVSMFDIAGFHWGLWRDYIVENGLKSIDHKDCLKIAEKHLSEVSDTAAEHREAGNVKVAEKWEWFQRYFRDSLCSGIWKEIRDRKPE
jgi:hypothetical protein